MSNTLIKSKFSYRPDIDGLRALAVILVILYHANIPFIGGGYIGVDVFFVISGFLITSSINKEMLNKSFSFKQFYLRRIRRIIPVLVFIMLIVTIPSYLFLLANHLEIYSRTLVHTLLSTYNFYFWINNSGYFVENSEFAPLLHTWSLSVEEQFYVIWPPLLLLLHYKLNFKKRLIFISAIIILGIVLSVYLTRVDPNFAYFLLPARMFELSMGAGLAMFWEKLPDISKLRNHFISALGVLLILIPAIVLNKLSFFPGIHALWPCLGTVLLIYSGKVHDKRGFANSILQKKGLVFIGLLSYSLYLWHWPIFVFIKYLGFDLVGFIRIFAFILTFLLSYFSWRFVEQPFRFRYKFNFGKTIRIIILPSVLVIGGIYAIIDSKNGFPERFPNLAEFNKKENYPNKVRKNCFGKYKVGNCDECYLGFKKDSLDGMLIGDSFANHTAAFLDVLAKDAGLYIHDSAAGGFPLLNNIGEAGFPSYPKEYAEERIQFAKKFKNVFIATNWDKFTNQDSKNYQSIINTVEELIQLNKKVIIFDCLRATTQVNLHKLKLIKTGKKTFFSKEDLLIPFTDRPDSYIVYEIKRRFPSVIIIDLNDAMCHDGSCELQIDNTIVYRNKDHLNTSGAKLIGERYMSLKGNPLKNL